MELAGRGVAIGLTDPPLGETLVSRSASAQAMARQAGATAAIWIDSGPSVYVVAASDDNARNAPLQVGTAVDPRTFATVATSLLAELIAPPAPVMPSVRVIVEVAPAPAVVSTVQVVEARQTSEANHATPSEQLQSPPPAPATTPTLRLADPESRLPERGPFLRLGVASAGIANGLEAGIGWYFSRNWRLEAEALLVYVAPAENLAGDAGFWITHIWDFATWRIDAGVGAGGIWSLNEAKSCGSFSSEPAAPALCAPQIDQEVLFGWRVGAHVGVAWQLTSMVAISLRLQGAAVSVDGGDFSPWAIGALATEFAL